MQLQAKERKLVSTPLGASGKPLWAAKVHAQDSHLTISGMLTTTTQPLSQTSLLSEDGQSQQSSNTKEIPLSAQLMLITASIETIIVNHNLKDNPLNN